MRMWGGKMTSLNFPMYKKHNDKKCDINKVLTDSSTATVYSCGYLLSLSFSLFFYFLSLHLTFPLFYYSPFSFFTLSLLSLYPEGNNK